MWKRAKLVTLIVLTFALAWLTYPTWIGLVARSPGPLWKESGLTFLIQPEAGVTYELGLEADTTSSAQMGVASFPQPLMWVRFYALANGADNKPGLPPLIYAVAESQNEAAMLEQCRPIDRETDGAPQKVDSATLPRRTSRTYSN